jgi:recombination protein RecR
MKYPAHLLKVIATLKKLPGVGTRSAERFAFHLLSWPKEHLAEMGDVIKNISQRLHQCQECGCLIGETGCDFCRPERQATSTICIIATPRDAFAVESTQEYRGLYHVLGGVLSPMEGMHAQQLTVTRLKERIANLQLKEVIIALDSTLEGDATALYLKKELEKLHVKISRLAFGLPMGSSLDYVDGGTLARAFAGRTNLI